MSKFDDLMVRYTSEMNDKLNSAGFDTDVLRGIAKSLGPSIYLTDASKVSCSDSAELDRVKKNFLIKKLGLDDGDALNAAIKEVCEKMGSGNRNKFRPIFYYFLAEKFGKMDMFK